MGREKDLIDRIQEKLDLRGTPEPDSERIERIRKLLEAQPEPDLSLIHISEPTRPY